MPDKAKLLAERSAKRAASAQKRKDEGERLKNEGNACFKEGDYEGAAEFYEKAILAYGPRAVYNNNLAAALLKLEEYVDAEAAATQALTHNHKLLKARFRRGLARKGQGKLRAALIDFKNCLEQDPACTDARREFQAVTAIAQARIDEDGYIEESESDEDHPGPIIRTAWPRPDDSESEADTLVLSDSSDYHHEGNGTPCMLYNRDGCPKGTKCRNRHAPDNRSVRDNLGRNVCILSLLSLCKAGPAKCVYAHEHAYLSRGWWNDPDKVAVGTAYGAKLGVHEDPATLDELGPLFNGSMFSGKNSVPSARGNMARTRQAKETRPREPWAPPRQGRAGKSRGGARVDPRREKEEEWDAEAILDFVKGAGAGKGKGKAPMGERDREAMERAENYGFSQDEVEELLSQGVKPWDEDAWDVLELLRGDESGF